MARICEEPLTPSFRGEEDDPASDLLGDEGEEVLEAFLDSALENDPVLRGILEEGLTQIIKAAIRLVNLQRRRDKGQSQGHSRENKEERNVSKSRANNGMNMEDPEGPSVNRVVEEGQGTSEKGRDNKSPIGTMTPVVNSLLAEGKGTLEERHNDLVGGKRDNQSEIEMSVGEDGEVGEEFPCSEGGLKTMEGGLKIVPAGKRRKVASKHCCYFCPKTFSAPSTLEEHLATHTQEKPFPCTLCGKEFARQSHLNSHIRFHQKEKPFKCNLCGTDFAQKGNLNDHIRRHLKEKYYKCPHPGCTSSFTRGSDLKRHSRVHSGEKPFACSHPGCGKAFTQSSHLVVHARVHSGEKPFVCPFPGCGKTFNGPSSRSRHKKIHDRSSNL